MSRAEITSMVKSETLRGDDKVSENCKESLLSINESLTCKYTSLSWQLRPPYHLGQTQELYNKIKGS